LQSPAEAGLRTEVRPPWGADFIPRGASAQYFSLKKHIYGILFRKEERSLWLVLVLFFLPELA
jgi:hypothetical protein